MTDYLCEQFESPFMKLANATVAVEKLCGIHGVPLDNVISISKDHGVELRELLNHLGVLGYTTVEGSVVKCPSE